MTTSRRDFLFGAAAMTATAGCSINKLCADGGTMQDFALPAMRRIRVGFVGIGSRGTAAVHRVSMLPGVDIVALCDKKQERVDLNMEWLRKAGHRLVPRSYVGAEAYKELCDFGECDVIYCATPWALHQPVALRAMCGGKIALVEVTSALTVDECWELVETSERLRIPCMQLENCCYGEMELLGLHLARLGMLGELVHGEGAYIHDLRKVCMSSNKDKGGEWEWRYFENMQHKGNRYPTHGLLPIMQAMDINRGDRFDYLVSLESKQANCEHYRRFAMDDADPRKNDPAMEMGDMNTTLIKTKLGRSIMVQHDVSSPRPYTRINLLSGTKGIWWGMPWRENSGKSTFKVGLEDKVGAGVHTFMKDEEAEALRRKYVHPLWKQVGEVAKKVGGHGGMDFVMDLRWAYCLQNGLPLDMDVYDLAASSCLCELTERSVRNRSKAIDVPDFTRGRWRTAKSQGVIQCDMSKIDFGAARKDDAALNV